MTWQHYALASAFFAALTSLFGKQGLQQLNSNFATLIRVVVILSWTVGLVFWRREWQWQQLDRHSLMLLILSGLSTAFSWLCYYRALQLGEVGQVALLDKMSVVLTVLLGVLFLSEPLTPRVCLATMLIFSGCLLMLKG